MNPPRRFILSTVAFALLGLAGWYGLRPGVRARPMPTSPSVENPAAPVPEKPVGANIAPTVATPAATAGAPGSASPSAKSSAPGRTATFDTGLFPAPAGLKKGDEITIPLPGGRQVRGVVNLVLQEASGTVRVGGSLVGGVKGSFSLSQGTDGTNGRVLLRHEELAYLVSTPALGLVQLRELTLGEVMCHPLLRASVRQTVTAPRSPGPDATPPQHQSRPGATAVLYLDFDGATVTDPDWNDGNTIHAAPTNLSASQITNAWNQVAEDYAPFAINVTTVESDYTNAPVGRRMRVIITPSDSWYPDAGGVAYRDSFSAANTRGFTTDVPCWAFDYDLSSDAPDTVAAAASHELGHTLGLKHDGTTSPADEYYNGHGSGATSWAPIMGTAFYRNVVQWSKGEYPNPTNTEDDVATISGEQSTNLYHLTNNTGYVADDAGNSRGAATPVGLNAGSASFSGLISSANDVDFYSFNVASAGTLTVNAASTRSGARQPNLDVFLELQDANGSTLAINNPDASLSASVTQYIPAGTYYVKIQGAGRVSNGADFGYSTYGSIGAFSVSVSVNTGAAPTITSHPSSQTVTAPQAASFSVSATGSPAPTYQWQRLLVGDSTWFNMSNGGSQSGVTTPTVTINPTTADTSGTQYRCVVTNANGSTTSNAAVLTINRIPTTFALSATTFTYTGSPQGPTINATPSNATFTAGGTLSATNVGTYTATATAYSNYSGSNTALTWSIVAASQPAPVISSGTTAPLGGSYTATANSGFGALQWALGTGSTASGAAIDPATGVVTATGTGTVVIKARFAGDASHSASSFSADFTITVSLGVSGGVVEASAGGVHSAFIDSAGVLWTMGRNNGGQLGDGTTTDRKQAVPVATNVAKVVAGNENTFFIKTDGTLWGMGLGTMGDGGGIHLTPFHIASDVVAVAAGWSHTLFIRRDGSLWGLGGNVGGPLGVPGSTYYAQAIPITTDVVAIAAGSYHSLFLKSNGTLWGMGSNSFWQLEAGGSSSVLEPKQIAANVRAMAASGSATLYITQDDKLWTMGHNTSGELGNGNRDSATLSNIASAVASLTTNLGNQNLFVKLDGSLWGMGSNYAGQLGVNNVSNQYLPVQSVASGVVAVAGGSGHSLFLKANGSLWAMGLNNFGQLGDGTLNPTSTPLTVASGSLPIPAAPTGLTVAPGANQSVRLNWTAVVAANSYEVWRNTTNSGINALRVGINVPSTLFVDRTAIPGTVYYYWVKAVNPSGPGSPSNGASTSATIVTHPASLTTSTGHAVQFAIAASGVDPLTYQWQMGIGSTWQNITEGDPYSGTTSATLSIASWAVCTLHGIQFRCVVTNSLGSTTSNPATLTVRAMRGDFNGDGRSDILWRHAIGGNVVFWLMNGATPQTVAEVTPVSTDWVISGTGDFNGDGQTDVIWRHKLGGNVVFWLMNGHVPQTAAEVTPVSTDWVISGTGDFNGDGQTDIVWRHKFGGNVVFWFMNGTSPASAVEITPVSTDWVITTTGDFNNDGKTDIVWHHNTGGNIVFWMMNGSSVLSSAEVTPVSNVWTISTTGDFNGDGNTDIVWRHNTGGNVVFWLMNGTTVQSVAEVTPVSTDWMIVP
ncbi:MAG TPA: DVUA0089 family protein [Lacunisphaera sp.]|nr:DVUA0089 family protein [Lacunisphaera sp.]